MADDTRLNSLDRFRKRPGRVVLEVYSHCEVPAGCGGAVLRWRNPLASVPVRIAAYTLAQATWFLDGTELRGNGADLAPGRHVLALVMDNVDRSDGLLMLALTAEQQVVERSTPPGLTEQPPRVASAGDGTWRYVLARPAADDWAGLGFDDRGWPALVAVPVPQPKEGERSLSHYRQRRCAELGAACLGLPGRASGMGGVWVRKVFEVAAPHLGGRHDGGPK